MAIRLHSLLLARPGGGHGRGGGGRALARPSADSLSGRLRVGFAWRGPYAALRKAAYAEGASCASTGRCAPPAAGGRPCRRSSAPWTGRGDDAAAPQPPLQAGAALCCLVGSLLDLCATFSRLQWRPPAHLLFSFFLCCHPGYTLIHVCVRARCGCRRRPRPCVVL